VTYLVTSLEVFSPISLSELTAQAELMRRYDTKYLLHINQLPELYAALSSTMSVLEHQDTRCTPYTTTYFDTAELRSYHDHLKGRRKRFKVRTRHYESPHEGFLEIKIKKPRGQTQKVRWPYDVALIDTVLGPNEMLLINEALRDAFYNETAETYGHVLRTTFNRTTLFDPNSLERITIDTSLQASLCGSAIRNPDMLSVDLGQHCAVIEIKSPVKLGNTHRTFAHLGIRPATISKCCASLSVLRPDLVGSPWRAALRELQGTSQQ
jgi:hypothetical protein